jgi:hypothetical protein
MIVLEVEAEEQTKIIATKADLILHQGDELLLALDSLTFEFQSQLQQHTSILKHGIDKVGSGVEKVGDELTVLGNFWKQSLDAFEKRKDEKDSQEVRKSPTSSCTPFSGINVDARTAPDVEVDRW